MMTTIHWHTIAYNIQIPHESLSQSKASTQLTVVFACHMAELHLCEVTSEVGLQTCWVRVK